MRFERVRQLQEKAVPVNQACCVLAVSRSGNCAARKRRQVRPAVCANHAEAASDIADYIVNFYNNVRLHSKSDSLPPNALEHSSATKQPDVVSELLDQDNFSPWLFIAANHRLTFERLVPGSWAARRPRDR